MFAAAPSRLASSSSTLCRGHAVELTASERSALHGQTLGWEVTNAAGNGQGEVQVESAKSLLHDGIRIHLCHNAERAQPMLVAR